MHCVQYSVFSAGCSVECAGDLSQPIDFVTNHEFTAFQLDDTQIIRGEMDERVVQFGLQNFVFSFQFNEMSLKCHTKPPLWVRLDSIRTYECTSLMTAVE